MKKLTITKELVLIDEIDINIINFTFNTESLLEFIANYICNNYKIMICPDQLEYQYQYSLLVLTENKVFDDNDIKVTISFDSVIRIYQYIDKYSISVK